MINKVNLCIYSMGIALVIIAKCLDNMTCLFCGHILFLCFIDTDTTVHVQPGPSALKVTTEGTVYMYYYCMYIR